MTTEEAIKRIQDHMKVHKIVEYLHIRIKEALDMATSAFRAQQTPLDRNRWEGCKCCKPKLYENVGFNKEGMYFSARIPDMDKFRYCPICGKPRTEEAWAEREAARWISVEDRLPELYEPVLIAHASGVVEEMHLAGDGKWNFIDGGYRTNVTHWMPLPTPPDREQKEEPHD